MLSSGSAFVDGHDALRGAAMMSSAFQRCGYLHLNREALVQQQLHNNNRFYLSDAEYPLEGTVELFVRFGAHNSPMPAARPDSADADLFFYSSNN